MTRVDFLDKMKQLLLAKRADLVDLVARVSEESPTDNESKDSADEAYSSSMHKLQSSLQEAEIREINLIDEALLRLKRHEYGVCLDCSEPISDQRLEYYPYAARCIECQEAIEE